MLAAIEADETDEGLTAARKGLERLCLVTRTVKPVDEMIRFVAGPDGKVVPDLDRKLPGRGAWVTATREAVAKAVRSNALARAFRGKAAAGPELVELVERLIEKAALEALSLANKAGCVIIGFTRVETALAEQHVAVVLNASDAAEDGVRKLEAALRAAVAAGQPRPLRADAFRGEQLDLALGRSNVVHAALLAHSASAGFLARFLRLARWHGDGPAGGSTAGGSRN
ncbi:MAG: RNA-binding protein [Bradyrhizobiaceae bacterium]|nr:RNA-binding protein [Bradyrhizobiaceae bacterium]